MAYGFLGHTNDIDVHYYIWLTKMNPLAILYMYFKAKYKCTSNGPWISRKRFKRLRGAQDKKKTRLTEISIWFVFFLLASFLACLCLEIFGVGSHFRERDILKKRNCYFPNMMHFLLLEIYENNADRRPNILDYEATWCVENTTHVCWPFLKKNICLREI